MTITCPKCGKSVSSDYQFCPYCGSEITPEESNMGRILWSFFNFFRKRP